MSQIGINKTLRKLIRSVSDEKEGINRIGMIFVDTRQKRDPNGERIRNRNLPTIILDDVETELFYNAIVILRADSRLDYLTKDELEVQLKFFIFDCLHEKSKNADHKVKDSIKMFITKIRLPLEQWEVFYPLLGYELKETFNFPPFEVVRDYISDGLLEKWERITNQEGLLNCPAVKITVMANNKHSATILSRKRFIEFSSLFNIIQDKSSRIGRCILPLPKYVLIYEKGGEIYSIVPSHKETERYGWRQTKIEEFEQNLDKFKKIVNKDSKDRNEIEKRLFRAMEWHYKAMIADNLPDKVIFFFFALETLLSTKDDKRKGEATVLRYNLLTSKLTDLHTIPNNWYWLYEYRSKLVHGSEDPSAIIPVHNITTSDKLKIKKEFIYKLDSSLKDIIFFYIDLIDKHNFTKIKQVIEWLEKKDKEFNGLITWISNYYPHPDLLEYITKHYDVDLEKLEILKDQES